MGVSRVHLENTTGCVEKNATLNQLKKDNLSEADNRKHREQVELINELKQNESKHAETINRLEKVNFITNNLYRKRKNHWTRNNFCFCFQKYLDQKCESMRVEKIRLLSSKAFQFPVFTDDVIGDSSPYPEPQRIKRGTHRLFDKGYQGPWASHFIINR